MQIVYKRCCGLDVHKESVAACLLIIDEDGEYHVEKRRFRTMTRNLRELGTWLHQQGVERIAMEATGVYWRPIWNVLEPLGIEMLLVNPHHIKNVPGRKTDQIDSEWIAELLQHGLLRGSFVPPAEIRQLRDLTRYRVHLKQDRNRIHNRIHKVLEDANIKLDCVATDILGVSGRRMIEGLIEGWRGPEWLADYARSHLRKKIPELRRALKGRVTEHHRRMLKELLGDLDSVDAKIIRLEQQIVEEIRPFDDLIERLCTIPGINVVTAWTIIAEIGADMSAFPDADHLVSWGGLCPGLNQSGGKRNSARTRHGNRYLRRALCQSAWAVSHTKDNYLAALFYRIAARHGLKKANVAVAHQILRIVYHIIRDSGIYREIGGDFFDRLHPERTKNRLIRRLEKLGHRVVLDPPQQGFPRNQPL